MWGLHRDTGKEKGNYYLEFKFWGFFGDINTPKMENQMEKNMEHEMETWGKPETPGLGFMSHLASGSRSLLYSVV